MLAKLSTVALGALTHIKENFRPASEAVQETKTMELAPINGDMAIGYWAGTNASSSITVSIDYGLVCQGTCQTDLLNT